MLWSLYQKCPFGTSGFWLWIGLLGWTLQSFVEFGLYIPALSWGAFFWLGWLLGTNVPSFDKQGGPADAMGHS